MIETGIFIVQNAGTSFHYAVDVQPNAIGVCVFVLAEEGETSAMGGIVEWAVLKTYLDAPPDPSGASGAVDYYLNETFIPDCPNAPYGAIYKGRSYIYLDGVAGEDEIGDYALIDFPLGFDGKPSTWRNRFAKSAREKVADAPRFRAREAGVNALTVFMPIRAVSTADVRAELICAVEPIYLGQTAPTGLLDEADLDESGRRYQQFYFSAQADVVEVPAGGSVELPFQLIWNGDASPVARALSFKLEADAGYLPRRRVTTDAEGRGVITIEARGLSPGEEIHVKLNAGHYTSVGKFTLQVV